MVVCVERKDEVVQNNLGVLSFALNSYPGRERTQRVRSALCQWHAVFVTDAKVFEKPLASLLSPPLSSLSLSTLSSAMEAELSQVVQVSSLSRMITTISAHAPSFCCELARLFSRSTLPRLLPLYNLKSSRNCCQFNLQL